MQFVKVIYYQLKYGLQKDQADSNGERMVSSLLDDSWFSSDSFLHRLYKVVFYLDLVIKHLILHEL